MCSRWSEYRSCPWTTDRTVEWTVFYACQFGVLLQGCSATSNKNSFFYLWCQECLFNTHYAGADLFIPVVWGTHQLKNISGIRRPISACRKIITECRPNVMYKLAVSIYMHVTTMLSTGQQKCIITVHVERHHFYAWEELFLWREVPIGDTVGAFARCYVLNSGKA
jgi:hypothetical protein